jgi:hypothetical protein
VALEGNLKDFSLSDMLRLLATGQKSGVLHVSQGDAEGVVCFTDGAVVFGSMSGMTEPLSGRLVSAGLVSKKQLRQAAGLQRIQRKDKAGRKLGQVLVDEGYLDEGQLETFAREQIGDELFDLFCWEDGDLRFETDEPCEAEDLGVSLAVDTVIADAARRMELWDRIREKIPDFETRFVIAGGPGEKSSDIHLKPKEWMLLCHLHGGRSVRELARLTGHNDFETARTLYGMYSSGLVERADEAESFARRG